VRQGKSPRGIRTVPRRGFRLRPRSNAPRGTLYPSPSLSLRPSSLCSNFYPAAPASVSPRSLSRFDVARLSGREKESERGEKRNFTINHPPPTTSRRDDSDDNDDDNDDDDDDDDDEDDDDDGNDDDGNGNDNDKDNVEISATGYARYEYADRG